MYKLAVVSTHPIQYHTPWYQALSKHPELDLKVYFCQHATPKEQAAAGFGVPFEWDIPLLEGYDYQFLKNVAHEPSISGFNGMDVPEIAAIITSQNFDAVLVSGWTYKGAWQTFRACWRTRTPLMVRSDSHLHTQRSLLKRLIKYPFYHWFISRMDAGLAVGQWSHEYFEHYGLPQDRIFLVPHVVDQQRFLNEAAHLSLQRDALRAEWDIPSEAVVYLFCGKLTEQKRPLDFVQAVGLAHQRNPAIMGLIVGDGLLRQDCEMLAQTQNIPIKFLGFLNQTALPRAYATADVVVLLTEETWGLVINEAMLSGLPALVSDRVGCGPDLIEHGQTGDIFPINNIELLSTLMIRYAENSTVLREMGKRACSKVTNNYGVNQAVDGVLQALERVTRR